MLCLSVGGTISRCEAQLLPFGIGVEAGANLSRYSQEENLKANSRVGYQIGGYLTLGKKSFLRTGVYFFRMNPQLQITDSLNITTALQDDYPVNYIQVPVHYGFYLVNPPTGIFKLYMLLGGAYASVLKVGSNDFGLEKDNYNSSSFSLNGGIGMHIATIVVDIQYDYGLTNVFKYNSETKNRMLSISAGVHF